MDVCLDQNEFIETLYTEYFGTLLSYANIVMKNQSQAQDIVQDAFHEAINHVDQLMQHPNPAGWIKVTLRNKIKKNQELFYKDMVHCISLESELLREIGKQDEQIEKVGELDEGALLAKIQNALSLEEYRLLKRLTLDKASHLEVAQEFGISVYTSQKRLERIRKKLRVYFAKE